MKKILISEGYFKTSIKGEKNYQQNLLIYISKVEMFLRYFMWEKQYFLYEHRTHSNEDVWGFACSN